jgi:hypothetical protein
MIGTYAAMAAALVLAGAPRASGADCDSIGDPDQRNLCRATAARDASRCESIRNGDLRNYCRAVVRRDPNPCESIRDRDLRGRCRAEAK